MPSGDSLREQVRRRLASKELFLIRGKARAERGSGSACAVHTVRDLGSSMATHLGCHPVWRQESEAAGLRGGN